MNVVRYEPWGLHREFLNEFGHFFDRYNGADESAAATAEWVPSVDIQEHADKYVLQVDVPGVDPTAIEITLEDGVLMGCSEDQIRAVLHALVDALDNPYKR